MKRIITVISIFVATLFWVAITVIPHHHHNGVLIFVSEANHSDCHHSPCNNPDDNNCCNNNNCEECPFSDEYNSFIKGSDDDNHSKAKYNALDIYDIHNYKYSFNQEQSIDLYSYQSTIKTIYHTRNSGLRAPPFT